MQSVAREAGPRPAPRIRPLSVVRARLEAVAAIDRLVRSWLERNFGRLAAAAAGRLEHLARARGIATGVALRLAGVAAVGAAIGLILKALARKELLLTRGEREFAVAINAIQGFVGIQDDYEAPGVGLVFDSLGTPDVNQTDRADSSQRM